MSGTELLFALAVWAGAVPTEAEVRAEARRALEPLCRGRCDVVGVEIRTRPADPPGRSAPGFEDPPRVAEEVSEIRLTVLFDDRLDAAFRRFATDRVQDRVGELGGPVEVTPKVRRFPTPPEPLEPPPSESSPPPPPQPIVVQPPAPPEPAPAPPEPSWVEEAFRRALEFLPLLLLFGLLAWLVLRLLRRMEDLVFDLRQPVEAPPEKRALTPEVVEANGAPVAKPLPPPTVEDLASALHRHRSSARRVFRRLLLAGEHDTVARAVALLGEGVVRDLARDPEVRPALLDAGLRTADILRSPITDEERDELLRVVQAELVADRVAYRAEDVRPELEPLLGWSPEAFARFVDDLGDPRMAQVTLRHAPPHLMEAYLRGLDDEERAELVEEVMNAPPGQPDELEALADAIESRAVAAEVGGWEADHLVDLLDALPADAQDTLLSRLERARPDFLRRNAGRLPVESALLRLPEGALAAAWSEVPVQTWIAYLRAAPADIRARALDACPPRLRPSVDDELSLRVAVDADAARAARKRVVSAALGAPGAPGGRSLGAGPKTRTRRGSSA